MYILTGFHSNLEDWKCLGILLLGFNRHLIGHLIIYGVSIRDGYRKIYIARLKGLEGSQSLANFNQKTI